MADRFGWMPLAPEVHVLQTEVGGYQQVVTEGRVQNGAIVTDSCGDWRTLA
jgi:hypothetical protein